jgi:hypothetical protein
MEREKKIMKEVLTPKVPKKGKASLFKDTYDEARRKKLQSATRRG